MERATQPEFVLRPWNEDDLTLAQRLMGDAAMTVYLGGPEPQAQITQRHQRYVTLNQTGPGHMFVIAVGPQRVAAGSVGFWEKDWDGQTVWETGWSVLPAFQGRGLATRATVAALDWARVAGTHRYVHAFPTPENAASNAVCRNAGFVLVGVFDFEYPPGTLLRCNDWRFDLVPDD